MQPQRFMDNLNLTNDRDATHNVWDDVSPAMPAIVERVRALDPTTLVAIAGGAALAMVGLRKRGLLGGLMAAAGGVLVYRGLTQHQHPRNDQVDEAALESFPASDPPSH